MNKDMCPVCGETPFVPYDCDGCGEKGCTVCMIDGLCDGCHEDEEDDDADA